MPIWNKKISYAEHLARAIIVLMAVVALVVVWGGFAWWADNIRQNRRHEMERAVDQHRLSVAQYVHSAFTSAELMLTSADRWIANHPQSDPRTDVYFRAMMADLQNLTGGAVSLRLADKEGTLMPVPSLPNEQTANITDRDYFIEAMQKPPGALTLSKTLVSRVSGRRAFSLSTRLSAPSHDLAIVIVSIDIGLFEKAFTLGRPAEGSAVVLVRRDGILLAGWPQDVALLGQDVSNVMGFPRRLAQAEEGIIFDDGGQGSGVARLEAFGALKKYQVAVGVVVDQDSIFADTRALIGRVALMAVLISILLLLLLRKVVALLNDVSSHRRQLKAANDRLAAEVAERIEIEGQLKDSQAELRKLAVTDPLTGLFNRRHFDASAVDEFRRARRLGQPLAVLMLDIDRFKGVNDTYGHAVGDAVLTTLAGSLLTALRDIDVVSRYGGEEFVVLLLGTTQAGAQQLAKRLCQMVRGIQVPVSQGAPVNFTISIGVTALLDDDEDFAQMLARADSALYQAKAAGRDRVVALPPAPGAG